MFDDPDKFLSSLFHLPAASSQFQDLAIERQSKLTKPCGALGRLEEISVWLSSWQQQERLCVERVEGFLFAGNHGIMEENISSYPSEVTAQMVKNFNQGGAGINAITDQFNHDLKVFPIELDNPTKNFLHEPAMSVEETMAAINIGANAVKESQADLLYFGEMGIGNTTCAAALCAMVFGGAGHEWAGPGTGLSLLRVQEKACIIDRAIALHKETCRTSIDVMAAFGGRELAAIMGAVVAARLRRIPVLLDGFVATAAVVPLILHETDTLDHCLAAHCSAEPGHQRLLDHLWMTPILNLGMRLGEGTGAALATEIVKASAATYNNMATFEEAQVTNKKT